MTSFFIETYGCSHNVADSEQMAGLLKGARFLPVEKVDDADIVIINTCTLKGPDEKGFFERLEQLKIDFPYKTYIIAGCVPQANPEKLKKYSQVGTKSFHRIVEIVEEAINDNIIQALETGEMPPLNLPKIRKNPIVEIIPISRGCVSECIFCKVKQARGDLQSYPHSEIISAVSKAVAEGVKEIWLTSQDCFCYGFDLGTNLPSLLKELINIPGQFKIRVGIGNPANLGKIKTELFPLLNEEKVFKSVHIPVQSGSNKILKDMKREYSTEDFLSMIKELKTIVPEINFVTDVIVGFPTEKEEDHWETLTLMRKLNPSIINISRFWPRSNTPAAKLRMIPMSEINRRVKVLSEVFLNIAKLQNERWMDWEGNIIIDEEVAETIAKKESETKNPEVKIQERTMESSQKNEANDKLRLDTPFLDKPLPEVAEEKKLPESDQLSLGKRWIGRNDSYKPVIIQGNFALGEIVKVKIVKTDSLGLWGKVV